MAANQAITNQLTSNNANVEPPLWRESKCIGDTPTADGMIIIKNILAVGSKVLRNGVSLTTNITGNDPGVGGAGGAVVQNGFADRNSASKVWIQSMVFDGAEIGNEIADAAVFQTGAQVWTYITTPDPITGASILYLPPTAEECRTHKRGVESMTYLHLPVAKQNNMLVHHFKSMIQSHNPKEHPGFVLPEIELIRIWAHGLHPHAKQYAVQLSNSNLGDPQSYARAHQCVHPANYPAHHPNGGNAHPNANELSFQLCAQHVHNKFSNELTAGIFALKATPAINLSESVSESPVPGQDTADAFLFASWRDAWEAGYDSMAQYSINVLQRELGMRTCRNCGGVNHFSHKDGVLICPTAEGSVPVSLLRDIKYPVSVRPWRFSVGGKGKGGKGKGKGGKGNPSGGRGRGRGAYYNDWFASEWEAYYYYGGDQNEETPAETPAATPAAAEEPPADASEAQYFINDDFSGWNEF